MLGGARYADGCPLMATGTPAMHAVGWANL